MLASGAFSKCAPNIATNIKQCGTVTLCNAKAMKSSEFANFMRSGEYLVMGALIKHDMEIKMCEAAQNGLYDFFMANKLNMSKKLNSEAVNSGLINIRPFVLARQYSQINNEYWVGSNGVVNGSNWQLDVASATNIPPDVRSFPVGQRMYIDGKTVGGSSTKTSYVIVSATAINNAVRLVMSAQNSGSFLSSTRLTSPTAGLVYRGTNNVSDYEKFCAEPPAYLNWKNVPFWIETQRTTMCKSEKYDKYRALLLADNPLYREFGDLDDIEKNRQLGIDWQKRMLNTMIWGKPISASQTVAAYDALEDITSYNNNLVSFDVDGGRCVGKRANMVGMYEQMVQCGRVMDLQGAQLNMPALFTALYNIIRVRESQGKVKVTSIDVFTDNITAEAINQAMISYYIGKSQSTLQMNYDVSQMNKVRHGGQEVQKAEFGFNFRQYPLFYPAVQLNVCTHYYFDDYLAAATTAGVTGVGRVLWCLDMSGIYPGIIATNRRVAKTGDLKTLASIDQSWACVMEVDSVQQTLTSVTGTMVVECPAANLLLENFSSAVPEGRTETGVYPATTTTTTTTSTAG